MKRRIFSCLAGLMAIFGMATFCPAAEAPSNNRIIGWRGDGQGQYPDSNPPGAWDDQTNNNILWRVVVGRGQSNPVAAGGRIFVTAEPDKLVAVDATTGKTLWKRKNGYDIVAVGVDRPKERPEASPGCGYATPTPVTDAKMIWASFGTGVVVCHDLDGNRRWVQYIAEKQVTEYGRSASPVLAGGKLVVSMGGLTALDPATGHVLWQAPQAKSTYGSPIATRIGDTDVLLTPKGDCVRLSDGKVLAQRLAEMRYASPIIQGGVVYFVDTLTSAFRLPQTVTETVKPAKLWESDDLEGEYFASPIYHDNILYTANNRGVLSAIDATTGKLVYQKELPIRSAAGQGAEPANIYPSLSLVGGRLLVGNDVGETLVLEPGRVYREICCNRLKEGSGAAPVAAGGRLFLRGGNTLYAIALSGAAASQPSSRRADDSGIPASVRRTYRPPAQFYCIEEK